MGKKQMTKDREMDVYLPTCYPTSRVCTTVSPPITFLIKGRYWDSATGFGNEVPDNSGGKDKAI